MTGRDFIFVQPRSAEEAAAVFHEETARGRTAAYWGGGTELISLGRTGRQQIQVGIDLKKIPELTAAELSGGVWRFGAGLSLSDLQERVESPLLRDCLEGIADHTIRNRLTLGGNLCGRLPYREAALPLLLCDAAALVYGPGGERKSPLRELMAGGRLLLEPGEFLRGFEVSRENGEGRYYQRRLTGAGPVGYPLLHLVLTVRAGTWQMALGGLFPTPAWQELAAPGSDIQAWAEEAVSAGAERLRGDFRGREDYKRALWRQVLAEGAEVLYQGGSL